MFDSYNIRKIAPRMLLAVIGVNLSIYLCVAAVDIVNVVGGGLGSLIREPFIAADEFDAVGLDVGASAVGGSILGIAGAGTAAGLAAAGGTAATGFMGAMLAGALGLATASLPFILIVLLLLILSAILIALAVMVTIIVRYGAIILLTLVSPVAIAMLVLPGTEKYFRRWWEYFLKTLIVYPIIAAIFAVSDVMAAIFLKAQAVSGGIEDLLTIFIVIVVVYAPLFMIPFSFKLAGGFLGSIYDFANKNMYGRAKPKMDKWKEKEDGYYNKTKEAAKEGANRAYMNPNGWLRGVRNMRDARGSLGSRPKGQSRRSHFKDAFQGGYQTAMGDESAEEAEKLQKRYGHLDGYDDLFNVAQTKYGQSQEEIMQALHELDSSKYDLHDPGKRSQAMQAASQVMRMQREMGTEERMRRAGVVAMSTAKTAFKDHAEMIDFVDKAAGEDSTLRSMILAKVQKNQDSAGRKDVGGGGFTETSVSLESYVQRRKQLENDVSAGKITEERMEQLLHNYGQVLTHGGVDEYTGKEMEKGYLDVVAKKNSDVALGQAHERSFNATTEHTMKRMDEAIKKAQARVADPNDSLQDIAEDEAVQTFTARLENMGESSSYFSGANRELVSKVLTGQRVETLAGEPFKVAKEATVIEPVTVTTKVKVARPIGDNKVEYGEETQNLSPRELADKKYRGSEKYQAYNTNKREFGKAEEAAREAGASLGGGVGPGAIPPPK